MNKAILQKGALFIRLCTFDEIVVLKENYT